jgi:hypothetical protein
MDPYLSDRLALRIERDVLKKENPQLRDGEKAGDEKTHSSVLTIEDRYERTSRQVFWLRDRPTPHPFPSFDKIRTVVLVSFVPHHSGGSAPDFHGILFSIST